MLEHPLELPLLEPPAAHGQADTPTHTRSWRAALALDFQESRGRTVLRHRHTGPLRVQRPLYPEGKQCQVHLLHPPAGIVGGDHLSIAAHVHTGASAQVLTPGATLVYRSTGDVARVSLDCTVESDACLEYLPHETIHFNGAASRGNTRIALAANSRLVFRETHCFGRPQAGEEFLSGEARWRTAVYRDGAPSWIEHTVIGAPNWLNTTAGMRGHAYSGTLIATPVSTDDCAALRNTVTDPHTVLTSVEGLLIARYLGDDGQAWRRTSEQLWRALRPAVIGATAQAPRIWAT